MSVIVENKKCWCSIIQVEWLKGLAAAVLFSMNYAASAVFFSQRPTIAVLITVKLQVIDNLVC